MCPPHKNGSHQSQHSYLQKIYFNCVVEQTFENIKLEIPLGAFSIAIEACKHHLQSSSCNWQMSFNIFIGIYLFMNTPG